MLLYATMCKNSVTVLSTLLQRQRLVKSIFVYDCYICLCHNLYCNSYERLEQRPCVPSWPLFFALLPALLVLLYHTHSLLSLTSPEISVIAYLLKLSVNILSLCIFRIIFQAVLDLSFFYCKP